MGSKRFNILRNIGRSKYVVKYHDGIKTHKDGSDFFDISIFSNMKKLNAFTKELVSQGYVDAQQKPIRCPDETRFEGDLVGCGSTNITEADEEGFHDCCACGLFFKAEEAVTTNESPAPGA